MAKQAVAVLFRAIRSAVSEHKSLSDRELLKRFVETGDQTAFATVVNRHSAMVLGVCRRVLHAQQDAEDACQAVFLILSTKAKSSRWRESLANWLYTTARKVAHNARVAQVRRARREGAAAKRELVSPADTMSGRELVMVLDEELDKLPPRYREPLVLCYLEGLTRDEAASFLGVPKATLKSQLERGRKRLAKSLSARGFALGTALLATVATSSAWASSLKLSDSILATIGGSPSPSVVSFAQGAAANGILTKTKAALMTFVGLIAIGWASATSLTTSAQPLKNDSSESKSEEKTAAQPETKAATKPPEKPAEKPVAIPKDPMQRTITLLAAALREVWREAPIPNDPMQRTITGKVIGLDGKPIVADLYLIGLKSKSIGKTKDDGTFAVTIPLNDNGNWLVATAKDHGIDFMMPAFNTSAKVTFKLPKENLVRGRVLDTQGKPVAGVRVGINSTMIYENGSAEKHLNVWAKEQRLRGIPLPDGDRNMGFPGSENMSEGSESPFDAMTDNEGRFVLLHVGADTLVGLIFRGSGIADSRIGVMNRKKFDPQPYNEAPIAAEMKAFSFVSHAQRLYGPEVNIVVEQEKIIRGRVTDPQGKPRAGVNVVFSRPNRRDLNPDHNRATTDKEGKYEIRGARKHKGYMVEVPPDHEAGLLPCQAFADDTSGYEPIVIDLKCAKGLIITGTIIDKETGKPVHGLLYTAVLANNPFVKNYPPFMNAASANVSNHTKAGRFRAVGIPGRLLISFAVHSNKEYKAAKADPDHPECFHNQFGSLGYYGYEGAYGIVNGCWCKVLEAKETDSEVNLKIELEPATKMTVKVVDADGKPVAGASATGLTHVDFAHPVDQATDTLTVSNVEPKGRFLAVTHVERKLVGTLTVKEGDKDPVVKLGAGGVATGRAVDPDGKPLSGLAVQLKYTRREVAIISDKLRGLKYSSGERMDAVTDANGEFRFSPLFPGEDFKLLFQKGVNRYGPPYQKAPNHRVEKHGETLKLGEIKLTPADGNE